MRLCGFRRLIITTRLHVRLHAELFCRIFGLVFFRGREELVGTCRSRGGGGEHPHSSGMNSTPSIHIPSDILIGVRSDGVGDSFDPVITAEGLLSSFLGDLLTCCSIPITAGDDCERECCEREEESKNLVDNLNER